MKLRAFTEEVADLKVRFQILHMSSSAFVWADAVSGGQSKAGSLDALALGMPARGADAGGTPTSTVVLAGASAAESQRIAERISRRTGLVVYASVVLPPAADAVGDRVALRLTQELQGAM